MLVAAKESLYRMVGAHLIALTGKYAALREKAGSSQALPSYRTGRVNFQQGLAVAT
jgi:hypothetical protein